MSALQTLDTALKINCDNLRRLQEGLGREDADADAPMTVGAAIDLIGSVLCALNDIRVYARAAKGIAPEGRID